MITYGRTMIDTPAPANPLGHLCKRCPDQAEAPEVSRFQLCESCAEDVFPGSDADAYARLVTAYGYPR